MSEDLKFQVAVLFDVVVPAENHYYDRTVSLYNGSLQDKLKVHELFRNSIVYGTNLEKSLHDACVRPGGRSQDDAVKITIASIQ